MLIADLHNFTTFRFRGSAFQKLKIWTFDPENGDNFFGPRAELGLSVEWNDGKVDDVGERLVDDLTSGAADQVAQIGLDLGFESPQGQLFPGQKGSDEGGVQVGTESKNSKVWWSCDSGKIIACLVISLLDNFR